MYLITGGAGFIGSHIAARLLADGQPVRIFDNYSTGHHRNVAPFLDQAEVVAGDIRDVGAVRRAMRGVTVLFHHAAEPSVPRSISDPRDAYDINVSGMLNVLTEARDAGCRRVVFASSSAVYGNDPRMPKHESMMPAPVSPYASSKLAGEGLCQVFTEAYGMEAIALRYFNVFGPGQDSNSAYAAVIPKFLDAMLRGESPTIFGDGEQSRDFIYIDNVIDANLKAASAANVGGRVFNIASGESITINQTLSMIGELRGDSVAATYLAGRVGDIRHSLADISAARESFGYEVGVTLREGLRRTIAAAKPERITAPGLTGNA